MSVRSRRQLLQGSLALAGLGLLCGCEGLPLLAQRPAQLRRIGRLTGTLPNAAAAALMSQLQLLQEAVPTLSRVAVLFDLTNPVPRDPYEAAARALGLRLQFGGTGGAEDLETFFDTAAREHADSVFVINGPLVALNQARIS